MAALNDIISRLLPSLSGDGVLDPRPRRDRDGTAYTKPITVNKHNLAEEGTYYVFTNPTIGTALAGAVQAAFSDTVAAFVIQNNAPNSGAAPKFVYLDYIDLLVSVSPASAVSAQYCTKLEPTSLRAPSGGNAALTQANVHPFISNTADLVTVQAFTGGAFMTVPAASASARVVGRGIIRGVIPAVGDELTIAFGALDPGGSAAGVSTGSRQAASHAPIIIPPQGSLTVHIWFPSNAVTGISAEAEVGLWVR